ncbi:MAG TPA: c-type cytochrome [Candidatus Acidoferrales bacterium]|nr:c-type cytochrome [Candidatus Acidoferrales bacterium]
MPTRIAGRLALCAIVGIGSFGCSTNRPTELKIPPEVASQKNPFPATQESIAEGNELYKNSGCAICHGKNGNGRGVLAKDVSMNLHNWRDPSVQAGFSDGELFYIMDKGKGTRRGKMPAYHDQETPEQIWHMVCYIRSLARTSDSN